MVISNETAETSYQTLISISPFIGSFIIAYFTIVFTQAFRERRDFEENIDLLLYELAELYTRLKELRRDIIETRSLVSFQQDSKRLDVLNFPNFSLNNIDIILSKKYLLSKDEWDKIFLFKNNSYDLAHLQSYYERVHYNPHGLSAQLFNEGKLQLLKNMIEIIDDFNKNFDNFTRPKRASLVKYLWR